MSTDTHNSQNQGESRRRRSRGGQNRNNYNNSNRSNNDGRQSNSGNRSGRQGSSHSQQQRRAMPAPELNLSWWQKLLKVLGFGGKEAVRPPRPERRPSTVPAKQTQEPRRSKTRDARTEQSNKNETRDKSDAKPQSRNERSNKNGNRPRGGDPSTVENRRVYVGNLSYETSESDLEELFKGVGAVRRVEIVYNRSTHRSKGYGFIEMLDIDEAKRTVEVLNDQFFMGRKITVSGAKSKDYDDAEKEEGGYAKADTTVPKLAPINPEKEQVINLIDEPAVVAVAETATVNTNSEIPTEEFSPQENTAVESQEVVKA